MRPCELYQSDPHTEPRPGECPICHRFTHNPEFNRLWGGDGIHAGPDTFTRARNFAAALARRVGNPRDVSPETQAMRKAACENGCEYYKPISQSCSHGKCGCGLNPDSPLVQLGINKLAWASEDCPVGRWSRTRPLIRFDHKNLAPPISGLRFNPSLVALPSGGYVFAFRNGWAGSNIFLAHLDEQFQPGRTWMLRLDHAECGFGREDPRLFWHAGRLHVSFIGVSTNGGSFHTSQMYARLTADFDVEAVHYPHYEHRNAWEKNWSFFSSDGDLFAVYSISPHRIVRIVGGHALLTHVSPNPIPWKGGEMRGGAPPVLHNGEWYHFFHDSIRGSSGLRQYRSGLYTFQEKPPFTITRYIPNPIMEADHKDNQNNYADVVFVGGAILEGGQWILSHGIHDRWAQIDFFSAASLERQLVIS